MKLDAGDMLALQAHFAFDCLESAGETDELESREIATASPCSIERALTTIPMYGAK
ncbi:MAG: hypothetical protein AB7U92_02325 [Piscinibacter sp.]